MRHHIDIAIQSFLDEKADAASVSIEAAIAFIRQRTPSNMADFDLEMLIGSAVAERGKAILFDRHVLKGSL